MTDEEFSTFVAEGMDAIPERFAQHIDNVAVTIQDDPTAAQAQQLRLRRGSLLFGLYEGVPKPKRVNSPYQLPDKITIFKNPILRVSRTVQDVRARVIETVWHEFAHHFGLSDFEIHQLQHEGVHPN